MGNYPACQRHHQLVRSERGGLAKIIIIPPLKHRLPEHFPPILQPTNLASGSDYHNQPRQSYQRNSNPSRYGSRNHNNHSGSQAGARGSYRPNYQPWTGSNSAEEDVEETPAYTEEEEEITAEETQMYQPHSASIPQIYPVVTLERMCNWLESILRRPDLARKLAGARLELGKDEQGENKATFWLAEEGIDPRSFSLEYKSLLRMAFSTKVAPHYRLQLAKGQVVVSIE